MRYVLRLMAALLASAGAARADGLLPSGQRLSPTAAAGAVLRTLDPGLAGYPGHRVGNAVSTAVSPDRRTLLVLTSGYNQLYRPDGTLDRAASTEWVFVFDIAGGRPVQRQAITVPRTNSGLAFAPDGTRFYVGGGADDDVHRYGLAGGRWAEDGPPVPLHHGPGNGNGQPPSTAGLAVTADGARLVVADAYSDAVSVVDLATGNVRDLDLRPGHGAAGGETPFGVAIRGSGTAYVSSQRDREIDVIDLGGPRVTARIPVPGTPSKILLNRAGSRLYVAADNSDTVQVIDTATNARIASIGVTAPSLGNTYRGAAPNGLALSPDESTLYVTDGGTNAVAVVDLARRRTVGLLPTGWYPNAVSLAHGMLYVANGRSEPGPNPAYCNFASPRFPKACLPSNQYVLQLEVAGLLAEPVPRPRDLAELTGTVEANDGFATHEPPADRAMMAALHARIRHVIYVIKENRTYDQILGDLRRGDGAPALVEFGRAVTPNLHRLAQGFVTLDNFFTPGEISGQGWPWSTAARETDFNAHAMPMNAARGKAAPYDSEGTNRGVNVGLPNVASRQAADPNYPDDPALLPGTSNDDAPDGPQDDGPGGGRQHGYLWDSALRARLSVRNYGFLVDGTRYFTSRDFGRPTQRIPLLADPAATRTQVAFPANPALAPYTDPYFRGFDMAFPDVFRIREWAREYDRDVARRRVPALSLVRLPHDHMGSFGAAIAGVNTPELQQADNDYAVGLLAERVARGPYRDSTLIFVVEDDAQDGADHVDAHRSTAYVIGPYVRQGAVVSARYSTVNVLRTIEDILGMDHLSLLDAHQRPMTAVFDLRQLQWAFRAAPSDLLYRTSLPLPPRQATGPVPASTHDAAWWAAATRGYNWSAEDRIDARAFARLLRRGLGLAPVAR